MHVRMMYVERLYWNVADGSVAAPGEDDDGRRCSRWAVAAADRVELVMLLCYCVLAMDCKLTVTSAGIHAASAFARHSDIRITTDVYAEQRVRAEVDTTALLGGEVMQKKTA